MCNYLPLSVPMMWQILLNLEKSHADTLTPFGNYLLITAKTFRLEDAASQVCRPDLEPEVRSSINESGYADVVDNLCSIKEELGSRSVALGLLRNVPNATFNELFETLGPSLEDTVKYCSNGGANCNNMTTLFPSHFPKCFAHNTVGRSTSNTLSDEGISAGVTLVLMTGNQLASVLMPQSRGKILLN